MFLDPSISVSFNEEQPLETVVVTVNATDNSGRVTYSLSGTDLDDFEIDSQTGELTFSPSHGIPNYENPKDDGGNHIYDLIVTAEDPAGNFADQTVQITLTDLIGQSIPLVRASVSASSEEADVYTASAPLDLLL